jgi:septal ring-binding cell division protein DamX
MPRFCLVLALLSVLIGSARFFGQETRTESGVSAEVSRNIHRREQWFTQGRLPATGPAATVRKRALRQKMVLRATRNVQSPRQNSQSGALSGEWVQLGPAPLTSDASGVGLQDYNYVAGRASTLPIRLAIRSTLAAHSGEFGNPRMPAPSDRVLEASHGFR